MIVPFTFTLNLNEVFKDIFSNFKDAFDRDEDLRAAEKQFQRQMKMTQSLEEVLENEKLIEETNLANMTENQRIGLQTSINDVEEYWQQFKGITERYRQKPRLRSKVTRHTRWISRDKVKVETILQRLEQANKDIKDQVDRHIAWYTKTRPTAAQSLERNIKIQATGLSLSIALRRTWRRTMTFNRRFLKEATFVNPASDGTLDQPKPLLRKAVYAQTHNVLVEHRYYTIHDEQVEYDALQLATFLSWEKPPDMKVLPCIATYHHKQSCSYGFVFDLRAMAPENPNVADNSRTNLSSALRSMTNLSDQLSKTNSNALFRYSKWGADSSFSNSPTQYLSQNKRLEFARSLTQTVYEVLLVDWVHQDIRSDNIWFTVGWKEKKPINESPASINFTREQCPTSNPYLFNFEFARPSEKYSNPRLVQRNDPLINLTRHPSRQYGNLLVPHAKVHDIYALGIILLEIGLGRSIGELYGLFKTINLTDEPPSLGAAAQATTPKQPVHEDAERKRRQVVVGAAALLPERMGDRYSAVVRGCLCSDLLEQQESADTVDAMAEDLSVLRAFRIVVLDELTALAQSSERQALAALE